MDEIISVNYDLSNVRPAGGLGRCPKNLQGTSPLTHNRALPEPALPEAEGRELFPSFWEKRNPWCFCQEAFGGITGPLPHYSTFLLTTPPLLPVLSLAISSLISCFMAPCCDGCFQSQRRMSMSVRKFSFM